MTVDGMQQSSGSRTPYVSLAEASAREPSRVGGKAASLAIALEAGLPVPDARILVDADETSVAAAVASLHAESFAVRSSAAAEDGARRSFAGRLVTELRVPKEGVPGAVARCFASVNARRVRAYADAGSMAVVLMPMIEARAAGVSFSADPRTGERDVVLVEAVAGTAERLVAGEVAPERIRLTAARTTREGPPVLSDEDLRRVAELTRTAARVFGSPQDVEWAFDGDRLFLLQSRPITALPAEPIPIPLDLPDGPYMRDDHHGVLSPLGFAWFKPYADAMCESMKAIGLPIRAVHVRRIHGHLYMRMDMGDGGGAPPPAWVIRVASKFAPPLKALERAALHAQDERMLAAAFDRFENETKPQFRARIAALFEPTPGRMTDGELLARIDAVLALTVDGLRDHAAFGMPSMTGVGILALFLEDEVGWPKERVFELLGGCSRATTAMHRELTAIVEAHRASVGDEPPDSLADLRVRAPDFAAALDAFRAEHALRQTHYDPKHASFGEREELLLGMVEGILLAPPSAPQDAPPFEAICAEAEAKLDPARRARLRELVALARRGYGLRDDNGIETVSRPAGLLRHFVLDLGRRIGLAEPGDAVYLFPEEHREALLGDRARLLEAIRQRKGEESWALAHRGPPSFGPPRPPSPPFDAFLPATSRLLRVFDFMERAETVRASPRGAPLTGVGIGSRQVVGVARILTRPEDLARVRPGEIAVCRITSPEWAAGLARVAGLVTDEGGLLSHPAIIVREYGLPAVLGTGRATAELRDGVRIRLDPQSGRVDPLA